MVQTIPVIVDNRLITSANTVSAGTGTSLSFSVTTTGDPAPSVKESGTLPRGVKFTAGTGSGVLAGIPAVGTAGSYPITFTATFGSGASGKVVTQQFTLVVQ